LKRSGKDRCRTAVGIVGRYGKNAAAYVHSYCAGSRNIMDESLITSLRVEHNGSVILNDTTSAEEGPTAKTKRPVRSNYQGITEGEGA
jgi:hypothetical protein